MGEMIIASFLDFIVPDDLQMCLFCPKSSLSWTEKMCLVVVSVTVQFTFCM